MPHHDKLAGPAVGQLSRDRESHCGDEDGYGVARAGRVGYTAVSDQGESDQKANGNGPLATPRVSRRVELYSQTPIAQHVNVIYLQALTLGFRRPFRAQRAHDVAGLPHLAVGDGLQFLLELFTVIGPA